MLIEETGPDGRPEYFAAQECWAVYHPPPGQSSGPAVVRNIGKGGFVGTASAMKDIELFATAEEAYATL